MNRSDKLENLKSKLKEHQIFEFREELVDFLQEKNDQFTEQLQEAISHKLDVNPFPYDNFESFLNDCQKNNPTDPAGYNDLHSRIYGGTNP